MKRKYDTIQQYALDRLKVLLMNDSGDYPSDTMKALKEDIAVVLEKYMDIDDTAIEIRVVEKSSKKQPVLHIDVSINNVKNISM